MDEDNTVKTGVDLAFKLVLLNKRMPVSTIARILDFNQKYTERMLGILERKKMVKMNYKLFREPEVMVNNGHEDLLDEISKIGASEWMITCPKDERGVMFTTSCQNCKHFMDVKGQLTKKRGGFHFKPENVVCGWCKKPEAM